MDELKKLVVERLVKETDPNKQIQILQEINKTILTKYVIQIGNFTIEPLWVEAYYYDQNKFPDCNTHMSDKQKNRFGQLYFHEKGRGGLDICLSAPVPDHEDYYLSVLLKATLLYETGKRITDGKAFKKQTEISDILTETGLTEQDIEKMDSVLVKSENDDIVLNAVRVNLQKPCFKDSLLATCPLHAVLDSYNISFPSGYQKQWKCSVRALSEISDEEKAREKANEYNNSKIENKYWELAKESLGYNSL